MLRQKPLSQVGPARLTWWISILSKNSKFDLIIEFMTHSQTGLPNIFPELYGPYDFAKLKIRKFMEWVKGMSHHFKNDSFKYGSYVGIVMENRFWWFSRFFSNLISLTFRCEFPKDQSKILRNKLFRIMSLQIEKVKGVN